MGQRANLKQTFGGKGVVDYHRNHAFGPKAKCTVCPNRPVMRAIVMAPFQDALQKGVIPANAVSDASIMSMIVQIKNNSGGSDPYIRVSSAHACAHHTTELERECAKAPSWCIVEFNRGPAPEKIITSG